jgi:dTDP-4-dehydrorhamnose 3,5-epimerase
MTFEFTQLSLPEVRVIAPDVFHDKRGKLLETYNTGAFQKAGIHHDFVHDFYSQSRSNVLRGLHVQKSPAAQAKLVHVIQGKIFDVVVDIRPNSDTFGQHVSRTLTESKEEILYVPEGFAHGYLVQSDSTIVYYKGTNSYVPEHVTGVVWNDSNLDVNWPLDSNPIVSDQDEALPQLASLRENGETRVNRM